MSGTLRAIALVCGFALLTGLTQVGGPVLLATAALWRWGIGPRLARRELSVPRVVAAVTLFLALYAAVSLLIVPPVAAGAGRVPLSCSVSGDADYRPHTRLTCLLNRQFVTPSTRAAIAGIAARVRAGTGRQLSYLDAGFPFLDGFPMPPHLGHRDGRAVDLSFFYQDAAGRAAPPPSPIGYFAYEAPGPGEVRPCSGANSWLRWDLAFLQRVFPPRSFDRQRTRALIEEIVASGTARRLFVEPHLRARLGVGDARLRFQGCRAARHDDHLHVEFAGGTRSAP